MALAVRVRIAIRPPAICSSSDFTCPPIQKLLTQTQTQFPFLFKSYASSLFQTPTLPSLSLPSTRSFLPHPLRTQSIPKTISKIITNHNHPRQPLVLTANASSSPRYSVLGLSTAVVSFLIASVALLSYNDRHSSECDSNFIHTAIEHTISKSNDSCRRVFYHVRQTGVAASVLWQSLRSVLSSANHEVRLGFELRVAALLADIAAANGGRRAALVGAGGGKVVDWLLETVAVREDGCSTQAEAARALAYLIADPDVSADVLGRPRAVPYLLRFIFSRQPKKKHSRRSSFDICDSLKGGSMLVAAIMDIVTSNCDRSLEKVPCKPSLPGNAETRDIAVAIEVIEEGGLHMDRPQENEDDDNGGREMKGIGIKILEGTTVLGLTRNNGLTKLEHSDSSNVESFSQTSKTLSFLQKKDGSLAQNLSSTVVPGLWDDLHCQHVAVPFAAWALASWAMASEANRSHIQELDQDGQAVMTALMAPERSVKWHGSLVARLLLEDRHLPINDSISDWTSSLLTTISQASKNDDIPLAQVALSAFLLSVERSPEARKIVMEKGLELMRKTTKQTTKHKQTQIDQSNILFATQTVNQLAGAVVNLAGNQLRVATVSVDTFPLVDLLSLEPFAGPFQNFKKDAMSKFNVADSASATLKGIKALTELCSEDSFCQNKIADLGSCVY
ncbi:hypothetical protein GH714_005448 [Hevea brasiliensis]|uniref:Uncharacterized protein n=1 Tax=Hevea brasiliensis TaxID=3981 RepID=A0A6A6M9F1_HEVBR|nr:hypothetical protein GH714_005448 [Hevea brasiliensis]